MKLLIGAYGLVVLLSVGVLGGYLMFGPTETSAPGAVTRSLPLPPDGSAQIRPETGGQSVSPAQGQPAQDYDWDLGEDEFKDILIAPGLRSEVSSPMTPQTIASPPGPDAAPLPAWRRYAAAAPPAGDKPAIAIIIDDVGESPAVLDRLLALDAPLNLSFFAWVDDVEAKTAKARDAGFEVMVHVPMEPVKPKDPGPNALLDGLDLEENQRRLAWHLEQFGGFVGFNNHMGSLVTRDEKIMTMVMEETGKRGLLFVDSRTSPKSVAGSLARAAGLPTVDRDVFLDNEDDSAAIAKQLEILEARAKEHGRAVAIGHPREATIEQLEAWIPEARARGFVIVPVSAVIADSRG